VERQNGGNIKYGNYVSLVRLGSELSFSHGDSLDMLSPKKNAKSGKKTKNGIIMPVNDITFFLLGSDEIPRKARVNKEYSENTTKNRNVS
jgi:hypothetical protein